MHRQENSDIRQAVIRMWQSAPGSWRRGLASTTRALPFLRPVFNRLYPNKLEVFNLGSPLEGHRMRLHWHTQKAYVFGTYEPAVTETIQRLVRPGQFVLDVGAGLGYYTLLLAKRVGPLGKVVAFEPCLENLQHVREALALNDYKNVVLEKKAVIEHSGTAILSGSRAGPLTLTASVVSGSGMEVEAVSLDDYNGCRDERVAFVKMDVEGAEADVLEGMKGILQRERPLLLIEIHGIDTHGDDHPALLKLRANGYKVSFLDRPRPEVHILAEPGA